MRIDLQPVATNIYAAAKQSTPHNIAIVEQVGAQLVSRCAMPPSTAQSLLEMMGAFGDALRDRLIVQTEAELSALPAPLLLPLTRCAGSICITTTSETAGYRRSPPASLASR